MRMSAQQFYDWEAKSITLLAMSGAGKTTLANKLPKNKWFHYSVDYRIGTKYLGEAILDNIKRQAMNVPFLRELLLSDSIHMLNNISINNLSTISSFLGKFGDQDKNGLPLKEFKRRQSLHYHAEVAALNDVPDFINKAEYIYGYKHFLNDAGGSVCDLHRPDILENLAKNSLIIYIKIPEFLRQTIITRAKENFKPLYYREEFLDKHLTEFMDVYGYNDPDLIPPDDFVTWVFPKLFDSRVPRYQAIADKYGYTIDADKAEKVVDEADFIRLIAAALDK